MIDNPAWTGTGLLIVDASQITPYVEPTSTTSTSSDVETEQTLKLKQEKRINRLKKRIADIQTLALADDKKSKLLAELQQEISDIQAVGLAEYKAGQEASRIKSLDSRLQTGLSQVAKVSGKIEELNAQLANPSIKNQSRIEKLINEKEAKLADKKLSSKEKSELSKDLTALKDQLAKLKSKSQEKLEHLLKQKQELLAKKTEKVEKVKDKIKGITPAPAPVPVVEPTAQFNMAAGTFNGLVWVIGNVNVKGTALINGGILVQGDPTTTTITIEGDGKIVYDKTAVDDALYLLGEDYSPQPVVLDWSSLNN